MRFENKRFSLKKLIYKEDIFIKTLIALIYTVFKLMRIAITGLVDFWHFPREHLVKQSLDKSPSIQKCAIIEKLFDDHKLVQYINYHLYFVITCIILIVCDLISEYLSQSNNKIAVFKNRHYSCNQWMLLNLQICLRSMVCVLYWKLYLKLMKHYYWKTYFKQFSFWTFNLILLKSTCSSIRNTWKSV